MTNKGLFSGSDITLIDGNDIITNEKEIAEAFNEHYINIVEKSSGIKPSKIGSSFSVEDDNIIIDKIIKHYQNHHSIKEIKQSLSLDSAKFMFQPTNSSEVTKLLKEIDIKKATGVDKIPPKLIKISADIIAKPLTYAINNCLMQGIFPESAKVASVVPLDKGKPNKNDILNYRPVSILNAFSKIYEKTIKAQLGLHLNNFFSPFISAYRERYSTQQVLVRLIEEWREKLDKNFL